MISVMSFNIRCSTANDGANGWPARKELVIERIRAFNPDLLGLQECVAGEQADYVEAQLSDYEFFARQRGSPERPDAEMAPILYRRSAFERIDSGHFWLSETPNVAGSLSWNSACTRITMWMRLQSVRFPRRVLTFVNTHLDYRPEAAYQGAKTLGQRLEAMAARTPLIVTGDFNLEKDSSAYRLLVGDATSGSSPFRDPFRTLHRDSPDPGTFHNFGRQHPMPAIDWILSTAHFVPVEVGVDRSRRGERYPSDHYPIFAEFELTKRTLLK